mmetsp:Transcript_13104/g.14986  ORF Transcript_13104/g.14986 Transcript_13104/m.14986 type:complete len:458 (+) Transcript_13104:86-1459(+)
MEIFSDALKATIEEMVRSEVEKKVEQLLTNKARDMIEAHGDLIRKIIRNEMKENNENYSRNIRGGEKVKGKLPSETKSNEEKSDDKESDSMTPITFKKALTNIDGEIKTKRQQETSIMMKDEITSKRIQMATSLVDHVLVDYAREGKAQNTENLITIYGANPNSTKENCTNLEAAVHGNHLAAFETLINHKVPRGIDDSKIPNLFELLDNGHNNTIAQRLISAGITRKSDAMSKKRTISCGVDGHKKWCGIAEYDNKLFCAPYNASSVLVIDAELEEVRTIPCGVNGNYKWRGIARYGKKLYYCPFDASVVLVIDGETESINTISLDIKGSEKWSGIARCGSKLFCAPYNASTILVIDCETDETHTIPCGIKGDYKWAGIAAYKNKLFCCPFDASSILVIDGETEEVHAIPCGISGNDKWFGIVCFENKLFCAPHNASTILVIDGETEKKTHNSLWY